MEKLLCILSTHEKNKILPEMQFLNASFQSPCLKGEVYFWPFGLSFLHGLLNTTILLNKLAISIVLLLQRLLDQSSIKLELSPEMGRTMCIQLKQLH